MSVKPFPRTEFAAEMRRFILKIQLMSGAQEHQLWALWEWSMRAFRSGWVFGFITGITLMVVGLLVFA